MTQTPKIGLALGAGAARGLAHLGVLKALKNHGIKPDFIAGSSMGALIGCLYACGLEPDFLVQFAAELRTKTWVDLTMPRSGFISGKRVEALIKFLTKDGCFEDLTIPFAAVATDIERGTPVILQTGKLAPAVHASLSIPVIFKPVKLEHRLLVDGGVVDQVPVSVVNNMGAEIIIAVDVNRYVSYHPLKNVFDIMFQALDIMAKQILNPNLQTADILIQPKVGHIGRAHFHRVEELAALGEQAAEAAMPSLKLLLEGPSTKEGCS